MNPKYLKNLKWAKKHNLGPKEMSLKDKRANRLKALTSWLDQKNHAMKREYDRKYADKPVRAGRKTPVFRPLTVNDLSRETKREVVLTPQQKAAKKWKFISKKDRKREYLYGGTRLLQIKKILRSRYKEELSERAKNARRTTIPSDSYVKFWPRQVLGIQKEIKKTHKEHLIDLARVKKFRKIAKDARRAERAGQPKEKKTDKKAKKGEKAKSGEKAKAGEKPKAEKSKKAPKKA